jgi:hypothetical protein
VLWQERQGLLALSAWRWKRRLCRAAALAFLIGLLVGGLTGVGIERMFAP